MQIKLQRLNELLQHFGEKGEENVSFYDEYNLHLDEIDKQSFWTGLPVKEALKDGIAQGFWLNWFLNVHLMTLTKLAMLLSHHVEPWGSQ